MEKTLPRARQRLGKYRIERRISTDPRATVYKAYDPIHGVRVALKLANPAIKDKEFLDEFRREARLSLLAGATLAAEFMCLYAANPKRPRR